jgi:hypothetical protein
MYYMCYNVKRNVFYKIYIDLLVVSFKMLKK